MEKRLQVSGCRFKVFSRQAFVSNQIMCIFALIFHVILNLYFKYSCISESRNSGNQTMKASSFGVQGKLIFYSCILQPIHKQTNIDHKKLVGTTYAKTII